LPADAALPVNRPPLKRHPGFRDASESLALPPGWELNYGNP